jgi:flavin reductase (DIM6/NTAB) family NADH-FMN oxidoreductase RutF
MDLKWGSPEARAFVTNVGLVTTDGPFGPNVMAAEWTHHVSYEPGLVQVCVERDAATHRNLTATGVFGVGLASDDQNVVASIAGGHSGREVDKIAMLRDLGIPLTRGKQTGVPFFGGTALNLECRVVRTVELGSHTAFVGEVVSTERTDKPPLVYHDGKYWRIGDRITKPAESELSNLRELAHRHQKSVDRQIGMGTPTLEAQAPPEETHT